jgi:hypothetical protein
MPVSNAHLRDTERVWDGHKFSIVSKDEAERLVAAGTHQITRNLTASQLKRPHQFTPVVEKPVEEPKKATSVVEEIVQRERATYDTKVTKPAD